MFLCFCFNTRYLSLISRRLAIINFQNCFCREKRNQLVERRRHYSTSVHGIPSHSVFLWCVTSCLISGFLPSILLLFAEWLNIYLSRSLLFLDDWPDFLEGHDDITSKKKFLLSLCPRLKKYKIYMKQYPTPARLVAVTTWRTPCFPFNFSTPLGCGKQSLASFIPFIQVSLISLNIQAVANRRGVV